MSTLNLEIRERKEKISISSIPCYFLVLLLGGYLLIAYLTQLIEDEMPSPIKNVDVRRDDSSTFSEESAYHYLQEILGDEPRVAGTPYHLNKTRDMKAIVDSIAEIATIPVHTDWQIVTGDFFLSMAAPFVNLYVNASNIIAVLEGESGIENGSSILVNCHYDSVPFAMGASDNAVFCAVMAETLNRLSRRNRKFKHNIVFLFNGAEENPLQASHGFLQHPWAKGVKTVVNLDAAGMNGKPHIFQVTDPRVLSAYQRVVSRPAAQSMGEALFSSGIIPSDTDFRIFRDFGDIHGIDIAFVKWAMVYHTRYDDISMVLPGVIQNAGNMMLSLLTELADVREIENKMEPEAAVYYDYLYLFLIEYSITISYIIDTIIILCAILSVGYYLFRIGYSKKIITEFVITILGRIACAGVGMLLVTILTLIMVATTTQLRYLSEPWIVVPIFWIPYLIGAVATSHAIDHWRNTKISFPRSTRCLQSLSASRLLLSIAGLISMATPLPTYIITVPLVTMTFSAIINISLVTKFRIKAYQHLLLEFLLSIPSVMFLSSIVLRMNAIMLPIMGRSPGDSPDYTVAVLNVALAVIMACTVSGLELLFNSRRIWIPLLATLCGCMVCIFLPLSPYRDDGPATMRHYWFHTEIVSFDRYLNPIERNSGLMISKIDANTESVVDILPSPVTGMSLDSCQNKIYCDMPLYRTSFSRYLPNALFMPWDPPASFTPPPSLTSTRTCDNNNCLYTFYMIGPAHNTITVWPAAGVNVTAWSFTPAPRRAFTQLRRPAYVIVHSQATYDTNVEYSFTVNVDIPQSLLTSSQTILEVSHHAHKIHHPQDFTDKYRELVNSVPKYYNIASFLSFRYNYVF